MSLINFLSLSTDMVSNFKRNASNHTLTVKSEIVHSTLITLII